MAAKNPVLPCKVFYFSKKYFIVISSLHLYARHNIHVIRRLMNKNFRLSGEQWRQRTGSILTWHSN